MSLPHELHAEWLRSDAKMCAARDRRDEALHAMVRAFDEYKDLAVAAARAHEEFAEVVREMGPYIEPEGRTA